MSAGRLPNVEIRREELRHFLSARDSLDNARLSWLLRDRDRRPIDRKLDIASKRILQHPNHAILAHGLREVARTFGMEHQVHLPYHGFGIRVLADFILQR